VRALDRLTKPRWVEGKTIKGINFFDPVDTALLHPSRTGGSTSSACGAAISPRCSTKLSPSRLSRQLDRLREIGVIKKFAGS